ncbi:hypothetical protein BGZ99_008404 [Dissophora globulifera]|uniref:Ankyrin n=1 Tax=Dissophora globulifera TaxID=979702 RepID=A0A9P6RVS4_9FUNG|nr:hypothetical protein BGZ99_008404 [Dissophora globulifera]
MSNDDGATNNERLMAACREDNLELLDEVLSSDPKSFDVNYTDGLGNTALHNAARNGSTECLEILLYFDGINVNIANRMEKDTPLHKAASYPDPDLALSMVQILIDNGANIKALNKQKQTAADIAPGDTHTEVKEFLERAALGSNYDARDIAGDDDDDDSDGVPSDDE